MAFDPNTATLESSGFDPSTAQPESSEDFNPLGLVEALGTLVTGATGGAMGYTAGVLEGIYNEIQNGTFGTYEGANRIAQMASQGAANLTYIPKTETGEEIVGSIGEFMGNIPAMPISAATMAQISQAAGAVRPVLSAKLGANVKLIDKNNLPAPALQKALKRHGVDYSILLDDAGNLPVVARKSNVYDLVETVIKSKIKQGSGNKSIYNKMLENGRVVDDALGEEALRQGFRQGDISSAKNSNRATKDRMLDMLRIKRRIEGDSSIALKTLPSDIAGDELLKRVDVLRSKALEGRKKLSVIADQLDIPIDNTGIESAVIGGLEELGINIPDSVKNNTIYLKDYLKDKKVFQGSDISKDVASQKVIKDVIDLMSEPGSNAKRAHRVKRQIDTMIDYRKKQYQGLTESGQRFAKGVRKSINDSIRQVSKPYAQVNDELSNIFGTLDQFGDVMKKINLDSENATTALGQEMRKLMSNYKVRSEMGRVISEVDGLAQELGGVFDTDMDKLVLFNQTLDDRFRPSGRTTFKSEIGSAIEQSLSPREMLKNKAAKGIADSIENWRKINDEEAFNTMQKLLKRD